MKSIEFQSLSSLEYWHIDQPIWGSQPIGKWFVISIFTRISERPDLNSMNNLHLSTSTSVGKSEDMATCYVARSQKSGGWVASDLLLLISQPWSRTLILMASSSLPPLSHKQVLCYGDGTNRTLWMKHGIKKPLEESGRCYLALKMAPVCLFTGLYTPPLNPPHLGQPQYKNAFTWGYRNSSAPYPRCTASYRLDSNAWGLSLSLQPLLPFLLWCG